MANSSFFNKVSKRNTKNNKIKKKTGANNSKQKKTIFNVFFYFGCFEYSIPFLYQSDKL